MWPESRLRCELKRFWSAFQALQPGKCIEILASCRKSQLPVRTLPSLAELTDEKFSGWQALSPTIAQLMEKQDVPIDLAETRRIVRRQRWFWLLALEEASDRNSAVKSLKHRRKKIILLDKSENSLFYVHRDVAARLENAATFGRFCWISCKKIGCANCSWTKSRKLFFTPLLTNMSGCWNCIRRKRFATT